MRALLPLVFASCTIGSRPMPLVYTPPPDPDRMTSAMLEKQDPGADTSKHPVLSRSEASYAVPREWGGCQWLPPCSGGSGDASGLVLVGIVAFLVRRRRTKPPRNTQRVTLKR